jgi:hypothetical protein
MHVPAVVWVFTVIISVLILGITLWVTKKAYEKKWEDANPKRGLH